MLNRLVDKLMFAAVLIACLQLPVLSAHYIQYLAGYVDALGKHVQADQALASAHGFASVEAMINHLKKNSDTIVRDDANTKAARLAEYQHAQQTLTQLQQGNYYQRAWYLAQPQTAGSVARVLDNFEPSIPLDPMAAANSLVLALILNTLWLTPTTVWRMRKRRQARRTLHQA